MHRVIRDHLEEVLGEAPGEHSRVHLEQCEECRSEVAAMREQAGMLRELRAEAEPRPGFYARVMERIEAQRATSIWNVFSDSPFGRRIALASMALAVAIGFYLATSDRASEQAIFTNPTVQFVADEDQPGVALSRSGAPDRDSVLVNLVTYREQ
jgi:predicted anti-sigma-YlaC factor YlaD